MLGSVTAAARDRLGGAANAQPTITIALGGSLLQMRAPPGAFEQKGGGKRGAITSYTRRSRRKLLELFNSIDRDNLPFMPIFITLTYGKEWPTDIQESKAHLFAFCKRIIRRFNNASIVWRLEWQERGAPHYHLLLFGVPFFPYQEVAACWYSCSDALDARQLEVGTRVERIRSWNGIIFYASKYLAKLGPVPPGVRPGRLWGVVNRKQLPRRLLVREVAWQTWYAVRRVMYQREDKAARAHGRRAKYVGLAVFLPTADAMRMVRLIRSLDAHTQ